MNDLMTKSFMSYVDLKKQAMKDLEANLPNKEMGELTSSEQKTLSIFFEEADSIQAEIEELKYLLIDLQELNESKKSAQSPKILRGLRDRINSDMVMVLRKAKEIKTRLETVEKSNNDNQKEGSYVGRTRITVTNGLRTKLKGTMDDFQSLREKVVSDHKEFLKRRYYAATGEEASDETIEKIAMEGGTASVFEGKREILEENIERHEAVKAIQKSLVELQQLFLDMAVMVETHGDHMNDIEMNVLNAGSYVKEGTKELDRANKLKKQRIWACWIGVVLLAIVLICLFAILF